MTTETVSHEKSPEYQAAEAREKLRMQCIEAEHQALAMGDHPLSLRHHVAQILCCGRTVVQSEGNDMTAERALLNFAAVTTKAIGIALAHSPMVEDEHDVVLYDGEAAMALLGLASLLDSAPRLIDSFCVSGVDLRSNGESKLTSEDEGKADDEGGAT